MPLECLQRGAKIAVGFEIVRVDRDRALVLRNGLIVAAEHLRSLVPGVRLLPPGRLGLSLSARSTKGTPLRASPC